MLDPRHRGERGSACRGPSPVKASHETYRPGRNARQPAIVPGTRCVRPNTLGQRSGDAGGAAPPLNPGPSKALMPIQRRT